MDKKSLSSETRAFEKIIKGVIKASNMNFPIQEQTDNFFKKLLDFLDDNNENNKDEDTLYNNIPTVDRNLEFLMTKFTKNPTESQKDNVKHGLSEAFKKDLNYFNDLFKEVCKKDNKIKETG